MIQHQTRSSALGRGGGVARELLPCLCSGPTHDSSHRTPNTPLPTPLALRGFPSKASAEGLELREVGLDMETHSGPRAEGRPGGAPDTCLGSAFWGLPLAKGSPAALDAAGRADFCPLLAVASITCSSLAKFPNSGRLLESPVPRSHRGPGCVRCTGPGGPGDRGCCPP